MNYRHRFHAGNFADVTKHALLVALVRALQRKEKGFLYLDTHAGAGRYDLAAAAQGDTLARKPEWPEGIGRLWTTAGLGAELAEYVDVVRRFDRESGGDGGPPRYYPGSPWIVQALARPQDRLAVCELHPEEFAQLAEGLRRAPRVSVHPMDGYTAVRAMLPPAERRALVLIDPPFEEQAEFARITEAVRSGLERLPAGVFAIWYPLTVRARVDAFLDALAGLALPPTLVLELAVAGDDSPLKMRGCGLVVINPPWQFDATARPMLRELAAYLQQGDGAGARVEWLVPER